MKADHGDGRPEESGAASDARASAAVPGARIVGWIAALVPSQRRFEWLAEWRSELGHAFEESTTTNSPRAWVVVRLRLRGLDALSDALWLRRRYGGGGHMRETWREATRVLRRQPVFALMVIGTLALGMGAATAIFSAVDGLMLRPLPFREPDQLVTIHAAVPAGYSPYVAVEDAPVWQERTEVFESAHMYAPGGARMILTRPGEPRALHPWLIEPGFLRTLGLAPSLGREFAPEEAVPGRDRVVMLGREIWRAAFASNPSIVGETIFLDDEAYTVVGVLAPELRVLPGGLPDVLVPLTDPAPAGWNRVQLLGRVRSDLPRAVAQSRLDAVSARLQEEDPREGGWGVQLRPVTRNLAAETRAGLQALAGAVTLLLLVACINAAGLLFVRGVARRSELAIRGALGGTRGRLFRQSLAECMIFALLSGMGGTLLAWWGVRALVAIAPEGLLRWSYNTIEMDARVLGFALVLTVLTGIGFGMAPALRAARDGSIGGGQRTATATRSETRLRSTVQALQVALAVVLLAGAGLLGRSFLELTAVDPGYDAEDLLVVSYSLPSLRYPEASQRATFHRELDERLRALPGIEDLSWNSFGVPPAAGFLSPAAPEPEGGAPIASSDYLPWAIVDSAYFRVMGTPILQGRAFNANDLRPDANAVIIDIDLANALWPDGPAVGRRFRAGPERDWVTVVGVAGDVKIGGVDDGLGPFVLFQPTSIDRLAGVQLAIRTTDNTAGLSARIRETIRALDPSLPVSSLVTAEELLRESIQERRFVLTTMSVFAIVALILAMVGVYGLIAFTVARRTREIGIRKAVGARNDQIVGAVFGRGIIIALAGLAVGLAATAVLSRTIAGLLFNIPRHDPLTLATVSLVLLLACAAALVVPARRAARVDAAHALRVE